MATLKNTKKWFAKTDYRYMQVKSIAECSKGSILQYLRPSLSYQLSLKPLFYLFLSDCFTQVLLYYQLLCLQMCFLKLFSRNVLKAGEKIQRDYESGQAQEVVFNKNMVALVRAAKVHTSYSPLHDGYFYIDSLLSEDCFSK